MYNKFNALTSNLLIAMPNLKDNYFAESVILICDHDETGAMGLIINRPLDIKVSDVLQEMKIKNDDPSLRKMPMLSGGPLETEKGFILHYMDDCVTSRDWDTSMIINENLAVTTSDDIIFAIAKGVSPSPFVVTLGYCEWESGQLEDELINNDWLLAPADLDIIFNVPHMQKWRECTYTIGIDEISNLATYTGHA